MLIVEHVDTRKKKDLQPLIREHIEAGTAIFSDELKSYDGLSEEYKHAVINHAVEYVNGNVHTEHNGEPLELSQAGATRHLYRRRTVPSIPVPG